MNKRSQQDLGKVIIAIFCVLFLLIITIAILEQINKILSPCPACDCSQYQNNLSECLIKNQNLSNLIENRPIEYINKTIYIPEYKELPKIDIIASFVIIISSSALAIFLFIKLHLFKLEIKFPEEIERELIRHKKLIKFSKIITIILALLLIIKLIILLIII